MVAHISATYCKVVAVVNRATTIKDGPKKADLTRVAVKTATTSCCKSKSVTTTSKRRPRSVKVQPIQTSQTNCFMDQRVRLIVDLHINQRNRRL